MVTIAAVGDLMLGDSAPLVGCGFRSAHPATALDQVLDPLRPTLSRTDLVLGNLECCLVDGGYARTRWRDAQMRGHPEAAGALRRVGFSVLGMANNHAMQHGDSGFWGTVRQVEASGMTCCGLRGTEEGWCSKPVRMPAGNETVGVLGYCLRPRQYDPGVPAYAEGDGAAICADVERLKPSVSLVVVSLHWGLEFIETCADEEVALGHRIVDAGASLVVGHHPHVARPVEVYRGGAIAYSLGNCVTDMVWQQRLRRGLILRARFAGESVAEVTVHRITTDRAFRPAVESEPTPDLVIRRPPRSLDPERYRALARRAERRQRVALYGYVLRHLWRYRPSLLYQLLWNTLKNRLQSLRRVVVRGGAS